MVYQRSDTLTTRDAEMRRNRRESSLLDRRPFGLRRRMTACFVTPPQRISLIRHRRRSSHPTIRRTQRTQIRLLGQGGC